MFEIKGPTWPPAIEDISFTPEALVVLNGDPSDYGGVRHFSLSKLAGNLLTTSISDSGLVTSIRERLATQISNDYGRGQFLKGFDRGVSDTAGAEGAKS